MNSLRYIICDTPDGDLVLIIDSEDIVIASGFGPVEDLVRRLPADVGQFELSRIRGHRYEGLVGEYYAGDKQALGQIPYRVVGSDFQVAVWSEMAKIPYGQTVSYAELAKSSGSPGASRAIGAVCGSNRLILLVPCHRVIKLNGEMGEYLYGRRLKQSLLSREGVAL